MLCRVCPCRVMAVCDQRSEHPLLASGTQFLAAASSVYPNACCTPPAAATWCAPSSSCALMYACPSGVLTRAARTGGRAGCAVFSHAAVQCAACCTSCCGKWSMVKMAAGDWTVARRHDGIHDTSTSSIRECRICRKPAGACSRPSRVRRGLWRIADARRRRPWLRAAAFCC